MRESLQCIRCGACLNHCPVYRKVGGHAYGWVYSGPIGAIITPVLTDTKEARDLPYASTLCGACRDVCPVKIDIPTLLLHLRHRVAQGDAASAPWTERLMMRRWYNAMKTRKALEGSSRLGRLLQRPFTRKGYIRKLRAPVVSGWTANRDFPAIADRSFATRWREDLGPEID